MNKTLSEFLEQLGSDAPTPGGGGAAALTGATAAGLVTMVARLTTGREAFAAHETRLQEIIRQGDELRQDLLAAIEWDANAFETLMSSYRLPKATPEEKAERATKIQAGLLLATDSPLGIARRCATLAELAAELVEIGNPLTVSDAGTAAVLAEAALQGALLQARINLKSLKNAEYVEKTRTEIAELTQRSQTARGKALNATLIKLS